MRYYGIYNKQTGFCIAVFKKINRNLEILAGESSFAAVSFQVKNKKMSVNNDYRLVEIDKKKAEKSIYEIRKFNQAKDFIRKPGSLSNNYFTKNRGEED